MERHEKINRNRKDIFVNNFIGGIAWGLGATVGLAIILAVLSFFINQLNPLPIFGSFIANLLKPVLQSNPQLLK